MPASYGFFQQRADTDDEDEDDEADEAEEAPTRPAPSRPAPSSQYVFSDLNLCDLDEIRYKDIHIRLGSGSGQLCSPFSCAGATFHRTRRELGLYDTWFFDDLPERNHSFTTDSFSIQVPLQLLSLPMD